MEFDPQEVSSTFIAPDQTAPQTFPPEALEPWDRKAKLAIEGMGPSPIADKLELYEKHYDNWLEANAENSAYNPASEIAAAAETGLTGKVLVAVFGPVINRMLHSVQRATLEFYKMPLKIFRQEVEELALAHAKAMSDLKAGTVRESFHAEYLRMCDANRQLRAFLISNFPEYVETADALKTPLIDVCKRIMLDQRGSAGAGTAPADAETSRAAADALSLHTALRDTPPQAGRV